MSSSRRIYTAEDRAAVKLALEINKGNVKATARDTGVPYMTVSNWKKQWEKEGVPDVVGDALIPIAVDFANEGVTVRDAALLKIKELIPEATIKDLRSLATLVGILDDKVRLAQGLATSRKEEVHIVVDPEAVGRQIGQHIQSALESATKRAEDITDAEWTEQADESQRRLYALPSAAV
jgi:transposase-like protein